MKNSVTVATPMTSGGVLTLEDGLKDFQLYKKQTQNNHTFFYEYGNTTNFKYPRIMTATEKKADTHLRKLKQSLIVYNVFTYSQNGNVQPVRCVSHFE